MTDARAPSAAPAPSIGMHRVATMRSRQGSQLLSMNAGQAGAAASWNQKPFEPRFGSIRTEARKEKLADACVRRHAYVSTQSHKLQSYE